LIHVPFDAKLETDLDPALKSSLSFAVQKMDELAILARALNEGRSAVTEKLAESATALHKRIRPHGESNTLLREPTHRLGTPDERRRAQQARLNLPLLPTTTIGSFPQTSETRQMRAAHDRGALADADYENYLKQQIASAIRWQDDVGLDVLVHGEFERNEMVQYFAEHLSGFAVTKHGWVQSYGTRYVRPPIIFGDIARPQPISVAWSRYAKSLTPKPVKGMVTGPLTMLQWSFARDDQSREATCRQIARALRDEVNDLAAAGIAVIQIDEPAFREGLPLRHTDQAAYLDWATACFRIASGGVANDIQIHTHMCYSDFRDIVAAIGALDADVISIEAALSHMDVLADLKTLPPRSAIGPGVYDVHAPRLPGVSEIDSLLRAALRQIPADRLWVNPDCGLKARTWDEVRPAIANMVAAAKRLRTTLSD
jgi:5-methyltetrahydropteroyltriglutamate--homocysteine methyltransferase